MEIGHINRNSDTMRESRWPKEGQREQLVLRSTSVTGYFLVPRDVVSVSKPNPFFLNDSVLEIKARQVSMVSSQ